MNRLELAKKFISDNFLDDAITLLTELVSADEYNTEAYVVLIEALLRVGDIPAARNVADRLLIIALKLKEYRRILQMIDCFINYELYYDSLKYIRILFELTVDSSVWTYCGKIFLNMNLFDKALLCYNKALTIDPDNSEALTNRGILNLYLGRYEEAIRDFTEAIKRSKNSIEIYNNIYNIGFAYHTMNKLSEAIEYYKKALEINVEDEICWNNLGNAYYNMGKYMESLPYYMMSALINPEYEIAWNNIGNSLDKMGFYELSILFQDMALQINPKFDYAWYAKAHSLYKLGKLTEAHKCVLRAIRLNSENDDAWNLLARISYELGALEDAMEAARIAVHLNPSKENTALLIKLLKKNGHLTEIERLCKSPLELPYDPENFYEAELDRVTRLIEDGKYEDAMKILDSIPEEYRNEIYYETLTICRLSLEKKINYEDVKKLTPDSLVKVCLWLLELKKIDDAEKIAKELRKRGEDIPLIYLVLSKINEVRGNSKLAKRFRLIYEGFGYEKI